MLHKSKGHSKKIPCIQYFLEPKITKMYKRFPVSFIYKASFPLQSILGFFRFTKTQLPYPLSQPRWVQRCEKKSSKNQSILIKGYFLYDQCLHKFCSQKQLYSLKKCLRISKYRINLLTDSWFNSSPGPVFTDPLCKELTLDLASGNLWLLQ